MEFKKERAYLIRRDPTLKELFKRTDFSQFSVRRSEVYPAMVRAIAHQMVHGNAAKACLKRLVEKAGEKPKRNELVPPATAVAHLAQSDIRACGFTENKSRALYELTQKECNGEIPTTRTLMSMSDDEIIKTLVPLRGIGQWTVEMYLIFSLGREDVFPVDDFGVRDGYRIWKGERLQRSPQYLKKKAKVWSPYGTLVARALWQCADRSKKIAKK